MEPNTCLISLMFLHEWEQLFGGPTLGLEVIVVGSAGPSVHHEVDGGPASKDMGTRYNCSSAIEPFGRPRIVERCGLAIQFHVPGINTRAEDPMVV